MDARLAVDVADRMSRKRAWLVAVAGAAFLAIQVIARPFFGGSPDAENRTQRIFWFLNASALLLALATGGGLANPRQLRVLVDDDISKGHRQTAIRTGYWVAMTVAMVIFLFQGRYPFSGRETVYTIVSSSLLAALFRFSYLEYRSHRDA